MKKEKIMIKPLSIIFTMALIISVLTLTACPDPVGSNNFTVTITQSSGGIITANPMSGPADTEISVFVNPDPGYSYVQGSLKQNDIAIPDTGSQPFKFLLTDNVVLTAQFEPLPEGQFSVTIAPISNGTITATPMYGEEGDEITLTITPESGFALKEGSLSYLITGGNIVAISGNTFLLPASDVTILAIFEKGNPEILINSGIKLLEERNYDAAISVFEAAYALDNNDQQAIVYSALSRLAAIATDEKVRTLMRDRVGFTGYPGTIDSLITPDWMEVYTDLSWYIPDGNDWAYWYNADNNSFFARNPELQRKSGYYRSQDLYPNYVMHRGETTKRVGPLNTITIDVPALQTVQAQWSDIHPNTGSETPGYYYYNNTIGQYVLHSSVRQTGNLPSISINVLGWMNQWVQWNDSMSPPGYYYDALNPDTGNYSLTLYDAVRQTGPLDQINVNVPDLGQITAYWYDWYSPPGYYYYNWNTHQNELHSNIRETGPLNQINVDIHGWISKTAEWDNNNTPTGYYYYDYYNYQSVLHSTERQIGELPWLPVTLPVLQTQQAQWYSYNPGTGSGASGYYYQSYNSNTGWQWVLHSTVRQTGGLDSFYDANWVEYNWYNDDHGYIGYIGPGYYLIQSHTYTFVSETPQYYETWLPGINVPSWFADTDLYKNSLTNGNLKSYATFPLLLFTSLIDKNTNGLNALLDDILSAVFGTAFESAYDRTRNLNSNIVIRESTLEAFGISDIFEGEEVSIGKAELNILFSILGVVKGSLEWLTAYDWNTDINFLRNGPLWDDISKLNMYKPASLPLRNNFLRNRNNGMMARSKASFIRAIDDAIESYDIWTGANGNLPPGYTDPLNEFQWVRSGFEQFRNAINNGGTFYVKDSSNSPVYDNTSANALFGVDLGKFFTPGHFAIDKLLDTIGTGSNLRPRFYGYSNVGWVTITSKSRIKDYNRVALMMNLQPVKEVILVLEDIIPDSIELNMSLFPSDPESSDASNAFSMTDFYEIIWDWYN